MAPTKEQQLARIMLTSSFMYHVSTDAGLDLSDVQLSFAVSPILYIGLLPNISGSFSGNSEIRKSESLRYIHLNFCEKQ